MICDSPQISPRWLDKQARVRNSEGKELKKREEIHITDRDKTHKKANVGEFGDGNYTTPTEI